MTITLCMSLFVCNLSSALTFKSAVRNRVVSNFLLPVLGKTFQSYETFYVEITLFSILFPLFIKFITVCFCVDPLIWDEKWAGPFQLSPNSEPFKISQSFMCSWNFKQYILSGFTVLTLMLIVKSYIDLQEKSTLDPLYLNVPNLSRTFTFCLLWFNRFLDEPISYIKTILHYLVNTFVFTICVFLLFCISVTSFLVSRFAEEKEYLTPSIPVATVVRYEATGWLDLPWSKSTPPTVKYIHGLPNRFSWVFRKIGYPFLCVGIFLHNLIFRFRHISFIRSFVSAAVRECVHSKNGFPSDVKIMFMELMAVIYFIYFTYVGDLNVAATHASYFLASRPEAVKAAFMSLDFSFLQKKENVKVVYVHLPTGKQYNVTSDQYALLVKAHEEGYSLDPILADFNEVNEVVATGFSFVFDILATLGAFLTSMGFPYMTAFDLRHANSQFQYCNYHKMEWSSALNNIAKVISVISRYMFNYDPFDPLHQAYSSELLEIMNFTALHMKDKTTLINDSKLVRAVIDMYYKMKALNLNPRMQSMSTWLSNYYRNVCSHLEEMYMTCSPYDGKTGERLTPHCVMLRGMPRSGKTETIKYFTLDHELRNYRERMDIHKMYSMTGTSDGFFEGYAGQRHFHLDEFLASTEEEKRGHEAGFIMNAVNSSLYVLPMAKIESKGNTMFTSECVWITSNHACDKRTQCAFKDVLWNVPLTAPTGMTQRFHLVYRRDDPFVIGTNVEDLEYTLEQSIYLKTIKVGQKYRASEIIEHIAQSRAVQKAMIVDNSYSEERCKKLFPQYYPLAEVLIDPVIVEKPAVVDPAFDILDEAEDVFIGDYKIHVEASAKPELVAKPNVLPPEDLIVQFAQIYFNCFNAEFDKMNTRVKSFFSPKHMQNYIRAFFIVTTITSAIVFSHYFYRQDTPVREQCHASGLAQDSKDYFDREGKMGRKAMRSYKRATTQGRKMYAATSGPIPSGVKKYEATGSDDSYSQSILNNLSKCVVVFEFSAWKGTEYLKGESCQGLHLKDGFFQLPAHTVFGFLTFDEVQIKIRWSNGSHTLFGFPQMLQLNQEDYCIMEVKNSNLPKAAYPYLWPIEQAKIVMAGTPMKLITLTNELQPNVRSVNRSSHCTPVNYDQADVHFIVDFPIGYQTFIQHGDSGGIITLKGDQGRPIIFGMHVCKEKKPDGCGFAIALYKDVVDDLIGQFGCESTSGPLENFPLKSIPLDGKPFYPPMRSNLRATELHGCFGPVLLRPARLRPFLNADGERIDPMYNALMKYKQEAFVAIPVPPRTRNYLKDCYPRKEGANIVYDIDQAVQGVPEIQMRPMTYHTSPGYPHCLNPRKGKSEFLVLENGVYNARPNFRWQTEEYIDQLAQGISPIFYFNDMLKDETRDQERVDLGKTRIFSGTDVYLHTIFRMFFGAYFAYIRSLHNEQFVAVGINVHSHDWTKLFHYLNEKAKGGSVISCDHKNFDANVCPELVLTVLEHVNWWYNDEFQEIRKLLMDYVIHPTHVVYDQKYSTYGIPSGFSFTAELDSLVTGVSLHTVLTDDLHLNESQFVFKTYGDDNGTTVCIPGYDVPDIAPNVLRRFGMVITHSSKQEVYEPDTMATMNFISRSFVMRDSMYHAPLDIRTVQHMTYYTKGDADHDLVVMSVADSYANELSHHGRDVFNQGKKDYLAAIKDRLPHLYPAISSKFMSYESYVHRRFYGDVVTKEQLSVVDDRGHLSFDCEATCAALLKPTKAVRPEILVKFSLANFLITIFMLLIYGYLSLNCEATSVSMTTAVKEVDHSETSAADRHTKEANVQQISDIGQFADLGEMSVQAPLAPTIASVHQELNMDSYTFDNTLDRKFLIGTVTWGTASGTGTVLSTINAPHDIINNVYIADKINDFRMLQAGLELDIKMSCPRTTHGKIMVAAIPLSSYIDQQGATINVPNFAGVYEASGSNHWLISATTNAVTRITLPFIHHNRGIDLRNYQASEMYRVLIYVLHPLTSFDGTVQQGQISIFAGFKNARVFMPTDINTNSIYRREGWEATSGPLKNPVKETPKDSVPNSDDEMFRLCLTDIANFDQLPIHELARLLAEQMVNQLENHPTSSFRLGLFGNDETSSPVYSGVITLDQTNVGFDSQGQPSGNIETHLDNDVFDCICDDPFGSGICTQCLGMMIDSFEATSGVLKEAQKKAQSNSVSSVLDSASDVLGYIERVPLIGRYASMMRSGTSAAAGMARVLGLSKPRTLDGTSIVTSDQNYFLNQGDGISNCPTLGHKVDNRVTSLPLNSTTGDEMSVVAFTNTPTLVTTSVWIAGSSNFQLATLGMDTNMGFVDYYKFTHGFFSGSHKFKLYITASLYQSIRMVVFLAEYADADWQACWHREIEIQGDVEVDLMVPYCYPGFAQSTNPGIYTNIIFNLYAQILSWSQENNAATVNMYIATYKAGGPDFRGHAITDCKYTATSNPRFDFMKEFPPIHEGVTAYNPVGIIFGEEIDTIRTYCHMFTPHIVAGVAGASNTYLMKSYGAGVTFTGLDFWAQFYRFWRGSVRFKYLVLKSETGFPAACQTLGGSNAVCFHGLALTSAERNTIDVEVPYYSPILFDCAHGVTQNLSRQIYADTQAQRTMFKAAGDDFSFFHLVLPVAGTITRCGTADDSVSHTVLWTL